MLLPPLNMQTPVRIEQVAPLSALSGLQTGAAACFSEHRAGDPVTYHQSSLFSEIFKFFFLFFQPVPIPLNVLLLWMKK